MSIIGRLVSLKGPVADIVFPLDGGPVPAIGELLMTTYALPFEAVSILLLAGMVGAIFLAQKEQR